MQGTARGRSHDVAAGAGRGTGHLVGAPHGLARQKRRWWSSSAPVDPAWLRSVCPAAFLCDEKQFVLPGAFCTASGAAAIVVRVCTNAPCADAPFTNVDPFLSPEDASLVCSVLKQHVAGAGAALDALLRHAVGVDARQFDSRLFNFALTALRGEFLPAADLAKRVFTEVEQCELQLAASMVLSLAYLGAFATGHEAAALPFGQGLEPAGPLLTRMPLLRSLLVVHGDDTVSIVHPMLARLLLLQCMNGRLDAPILPAQLEATHGKVREFLKQEYRCTANFPLRRADCGRPC